MEKTCTHCKTPKSIESFGWSTRRNKNGTIVKYQDAQCKSCTNRKQYEHRKANPDQYEKMLERGRKRAKRRYERDPNHAKPYIKKYYDKLIASGNFKNIWLFRKYGITMEDYTQLMADQEGRCKICNRQNEELGKALNVDHCHTTGKVRGLLCSNCNRAIGFFKENIEWLEKAIDYLKSYQNSLEVHP